MSAQDPMNPVSDTQFIGQMAQFSSLQANQGMLKNLQNLQNSQSVQQANSLLGRLVQVQAASGQTVAGLVSAVQLTAGTPNLIINGDSYSLSQLLAVTEAPTTK